MDHSEARGLMAEIQIGEETFALVQDSLLPAGKRAILRSDLPTNAPSPGRIVNVEWEFTSIGHSNESTAGKLGTDYTTNLETRFKRRLLSLGKRTAVDITGSPVTDSGGYAAFAYGSPSSAYGGTEALFGTSDASGDKVNFFDEQQGRLFAHHGAISTQLDLSDWGEEDNYIHANIITDAVDWRAYGWVGFGPGKAVAQRTNVTATGSTYVDVGSVAGQYARKFALGSDRLWVATGVNQVVYTLDTYATFSSPFEVGDHNHLTNGVGTLGPFTFFGKQGGIYSFTDQGKPVPLSKALEHHLSTLNGSQFADPGWGWLYYISALGLRCVNTRGVDNPVGIGVRMPDFTGHGGIATALWVADSDLFVAYLVGTDTYIYRGVLNEDNAARINANGQPDWYPFRFLEDTQCNRGYSSSTPTNPVIVWGEDGDIAYESFDPLGRDDLWSSRLYSTSGGVWYGTTLDRDNHMVKSVRKARIRVLNVEPCSTWQLAFAYDVEPWHTPTYIDCGPELDVPGYWDLIPAQGSRPLTNISGRNFKPRLTQTADGTHAETLPPEVNGTLEVEYDEHPDTIEVVQVQLTGDDTDDMMLRLRKLKDKQAKAGPHKVYLDGESCWAMIADTEQKRHDAKGDGVEVVAVALHLWAVA